MPLLQSILSAILLTILVTPPGWAVPYSYVLPPDDVGVVGQTETDQVRNDDTLLDIARRHGLGFEEMINANPTVDIWVPEVGTVVALPTRHILPDAPREGIVINLPEMRIYYYPKHKKGELPTVVTYPVSIGRMDWQTPLGLTSVVTKVTNPTWTPPATIRKEHAEKGDILPAVVPAGVDNPLGLFALRLGIAGYLIHGTDKPWGIGMRVTHGCMRLYPEDIESLFKAVPVGTPVRLVSQPFKVGWLAGVLYLQTFPPLEEDRGKVIADNVLVNLVTKAMEGRQHYRVDTGAIQRATNEIRFTDPDDQHGIPIPIPVATELQ